MQYVSTRGSAPTLNFENVLLTGLARDGGLYVPDAWPVMAADDIAALSGLSYAEAAVRVMIPFLGESIANDDFAAIVKKAYAGFRHKAVAPLSEIGEGEWLLELFHGPTLAFKDVAMQLIGPLFDHVLARRGKRVTIVGATSGDTGSAAINAFKGRDAADIFILFPEGRVSEVQRRQMTTLNESNVHAVAVQGTFDDCQALVKAMFNDHAFRDRAQLGAVNSINWARVMAQVVYYFTSAVALGAPHRPVAYSVPTGNFGDIFAGYVARAMGLPISQMVIATNTNDILARTFETGAYATGKVVPTLSPSMDIQVSSNFERVLFDACGRDGGAVTGVMNSLAQSGSFTIADGPLSALRDLFDAGRADDEISKATICTILDETGTLIDTHTAVGIHAGRTLRRDASVPLIALATAHAAKFPDAVEAATGIRPDLPPHLADLYGRPERMDVLANDLKTVETFIEERGRVLA